MAQSPHRNKSEVEALVRSASRRRMLLLTCEQLAIALAIVFGGAILMLLLGTEILEWYWLAVLAAAGVAIGAARIVPQRVGPYRTAQMLDRRLQLSDVISTAWHLLSQDAAHKNVTAHYQIAQAEEVAKAARPALAFPLRTRRSYAVALALGGIVFGLFATRYLLQSNLDFRKTMVPRSVIAVIESARDWLSAEIRPAKVDSSPQNDEKDDAAASFPRQKDPEGANNRKSSAGRDANSADPMQTRTAEKEKRARAGEPGTKTMESQRAANNTDSNHDQSQGQRDPNGGQRANSSQQDRSQSTANNQGQSPGLLDKMRDAISSLMAKLRSEPGTSEGKQVGQPSNEDSQRAASNNEQEGPSLENRNGQNRATQAQAQGQAAAQAQMTRSPGSSPSEEQNSPSSHSGIGSQNGSKGVKEAEQLKAMGKLAEIIGKRSAGLTGEAMVETSSGKQQLKTQYSQKIGQHADLGGEINRDEVPLADQQYVRAYMEQVHRQPKTDE